MPPKTENARSLAWKALLRWNRGGVFAETLLARATAEQKLSLSDRGLMQSIVYATLRNLRLLEHLRYTLRPGALEEKMHWLVLAGLCELFILNHAEHAVVSETVKLAPARARGVVNGMLRNAVRRRGEFEAALPSLPPAVRYSMPDWLAARWLREFGEQEATAMMAWNLQTPPVYARLNPLKPMDIPAAWIPHPGAPGWYCIHGSLPLEALQAGQVYVADPSTRHCIRLLAPQPGEKILDACAAPGGKSAAILAATGGDVQLLATELEPHRLPQLKENLLRVGGQLPEVAQHDWTRPCPPEWRGSFDAVLLDVPCSNSGVLQRRVDARWRMQEEEIARLSALQLQILERAAEAVRSGGRLVYSTCSIDRREDRAVVESFLATHPEFSLKEDYLALPHREQADGAYAALLVHS
ncbi:MAG: hypothetical protein IJ498_01500 [Akkermansia sp.]|nr:hypothetical protein [Akkermansia sp.]